MNTSIRKAYPGHAKQATEIEAWLVGKRVDGDGG